VIRVESSFRGEGFYRSFYFGEGGWNGTIVLGRFARYLGLLTGLFVDGLRRSGLEQSMLMAGGGYRGAR